MTTPRGKTEWQKLVDVTLKDHEKRLSEHEKTTAVFQAVAEENNKFIQDRFNRVQDNINTMNKDLSEKMTSQIMPIKTGINRILWAIALAIVTAMAHWVLNGGLKGL